MDPRTFLPPRAIATAPAVSVGEPARALPAPVGRPAVVSFLRHVGCPFAEATLLALRAQAAAAGDVAWLAVSHAHEDATARWCRAVGGAEAVEVVSDPERRFYAAWGLGRTSAAHFMGREPLREVMRLGRRGIRNRHPVGTRWQMAGTFAIDAGGTVRYVHRPRHAGDLADLDAALLGARGDGYAPHDR